jgi:hypothetical protein
VFLSSCYNNSTILFWGVFRALFYDLFYIVLALIGWIYSDVCELVCLYKIIDKFVVFLLVYYDYCFPFVCLCYYLLVFSYVPPNVILVLYSCFVVAVFCILFLKCLIKLGVAYLRYFFVLFMLHSLRLFRLPVLMFQSSYLFCGRRFF